MMHPPDSLKARVLAAAKQKPAPVRRTHDRLGLWLALGAVASMVGIFLLAGGLHHSADRPAAFSAPIAVGAIVIALGASFMVLPRRGSMLSRPRGQLIALVVAVPLLVGLWLMAWHAAYDDPFTRLGVRCFALTLATAPWPFVALAYWRGNTDPVSARWTGAAVGVTAGAWAAVMVVLWCPLADPGHVLRGHVLPFVALSALGALLGARVFGLRKPE